MVLRQSGSIHLINTLAASLLKVNRRKTKVRIKCVCQSSGNVLQGNSNALAAVTASHDSVLTDNVRTDTTSRIALALNSGSSLAGTMTGLDSFSIDGSGGGFVEPSAQLSTLWAESDSFRFDNGLAGRSGSARSQRVALHGVVGKSLTLSQGAQLTPWVRLSAIQELESNNHMTLFDQRFSNDLACTRAEMTLGMSAQLQPDLQLYTEAATSKARHMNSP
nr:autotransporter outer membrane beta-barrel domain-containing protein [Pantoea sp. JGM49]